MLNFLLSLFMSGSPIPLPCEPVAGLDEVLRPRAIHWIIAGEQHGTSETPAAFANLACLASRSEPVVVAVEQPDMDQPLIDAFIASDGGPAARQAFLSGAMWNVKTKSGQSSQAVFRLFDSLRVMHLAGRVQRVVAFVPRFQGVQASFDQAAWEESLAKSLVEKTSGVQRVLVLAGNSHARRMAAAYSSGVSPMAAHMPAARTASINVRANGGLMWACVASGCGIHPYGGDGVEHQAGVEVSSDPNAPYTATWFLGVPASASQPE